MSHTVTWSQVGSSSLDDGRWTTDCFHVLESSGQWSLGVSCGLKGQLQLHYYYYYYYYYYCYCYCYYFSYCYFYYNRSLKYGGTWCHLPVSANERPELGQVLGPWRGVRDLVNKPSESNKGTRLRGRERGVGGGE